MGYNFCDLGYAGRSASVEISQAPQRRSATGHVEDQPALHGQPMDATWHHNRVLATTSG